MDNDEKNYSCGLLHVHVIYLSQKTVKQVTCPFAIYPGIYMQKTVFIFISVFFFAPSG